ncbi:MAG: transcription elongation factor [Elusimicrobia bacterium]|nr:transcription elongation factor [Elusimicrobiota bacterium]
MPEKETLRRARKDRRQGKAPTTQAGEFIREEMHHIREGKHGAASAKQAIAIGLSKARKAGVKLAPYRGRRASPGPIRMRKANPRRSRATLRALRREGRGAASRAALSRRSRESAAAR